ncbi:hypothetical protein DID88_006342 [Monilinia fructigena]|uniref:Uncharacterized protein n=1 Tax=Monilinia fructigena TaxID=38457 RepID=A0A395J2C0_9HELO|nr:hypothetical protein DID88_006342 [Monilinia fructigena]
MGRRGSCLVGVWLLLLRKTEGQPSSSTPTPNPAKPTTYPPTPTPTSSFLNSSGEWASISGLSSLETSRLTIEKYYSPTLKAWLGDLGDGVHDGGPKDPRIGIIRVDAKTATYAIVRKSLLARERSSRKAL